MNLHEPPTRIFTLHLFIILTFLLALLPQQATQQTLQKLNSWSGTCSGNKRQIIQVIGSDKIVFVCTIFGSNSAEITTYNSPASLNTFIAQNEVQNICGSVSQIDLTQYVVLGIGGGSPQYYINSGTQSSLLKIKGITSTLNFNGCQTQIPTTSLVLSGSVALELLDTSLASNSAPIVTVPSVHAGGSINTLKPFLSTIFVVSGPGSGDNFCSVRDRTTVSISVIQSTATLGVGIQQIVINQTAGSTFLSGFLNTDTILYDKTTGAVIRTFVNGQTQQFGLIYLSHSGYFLARTRQGAPTFTRIFLDSDVTVTALLQDNTDTIGISDGVLYIPPSLTTLTEINFAFTASNAQAEHIQFWRISGLGATNFKNCHSSCLICKGVTSSDCLVCKPGFWISPHGSFGVCSQTCDPACRQCRGGSFLNCVPGECNPGFLQVGFTNECRRICSANQVLITASNSCLGCDPSCGGVTCSGSGYQNCGPASTSCSVGYQLIGTECRRICQIGEQFVPGSNQCIQCDQACGGSCSGVSYRNCGPQAITCALEYQLIGTECRKYCSQDENWIEGENLCWPISSKTIQVKAYEHKDVSQKNYERYTLIIALDLISSITVLPVNKLNEVLYKNLNQEKQILLGQIKKALKFDLLNLQEQGSNYTSLSQTSHQIDFQYMIDKILIKFEFFDKNPQKLRFRLSPINPSSNNYLNLTLPFQMGIYYMIRPLTQPNGTLGTLETFEFDFLAQKYEKEIIKLGLDTSTYLSYSLLIIIIIGMALKAATSCSMPSFYNFISLLQIIDLIQKIGTISAIFGPCLSNFILNLDGPDDFVKFQADQQQIDSDVLSRRNFRTNWQRNGIEQIVIYDQLYLGSLLILFWMVIAVVSRYKDHKLSKLNQKITDNYLFGAFNSNEKNEKIQEIQEIKNNLGKKQEENNCEELINLQVKINKAKYYFKKNISLLQIIFYFILLIFITDLFYSSVLALSQIDYLSLNKHDSFLVLYSFVISSLVLIIVLLQLILVVELNIKESSSLNQHKEHKDEQQQFQNEFDKGKDIGKNQKFKRRFQNRPNISQKPQNQTNQIHPLAPIEHIENILEKSKHENQDTPHKPSFQKFQKAIYQKFYEQNHFSQNKKNKFIKELSMVNVKPQAYKKSLLVRMQSSLLLSKYCLFMIPLATLSTQPEAQLGVCLGVITVPVLMNVIAWCKRKYPESKFTAFFHLLTDFILILFISGCYLLLEKAKTEAQLKRQEEVQYFLFGLACLGILSELLVILFDILFSFRDLLVQFKEGIQKRQKQKKILEKVLQDAKKTGVDLNSQANSNMQKYKNIKFQELDSKTGVLGTQEQGQTDHVFMSERVESQDWQKYQKDHQEDSNAKIEFLNSPKIKPSLEIIEETKEAKIDRIKQNLRKMQGGYKRKLKIPIQSKRRKQDYPKLQESKLNSDLQKPK